MRSAYMTMIKEYHYDEFRAVRALRSVVAVNILNHTMALTSLDLWFRAHLEEEDIKKASHLHLSSDLIAQCEILCYSVTFIYSENYVASCQ